MGIAFVSEKTYQFIGLKIRAIGHFFAGRHSCGSRNPGFFSLFFWIPVFTGMT
jgi:hypothetical protein